MASTNATINILVGLGFSLLHLTSSAQVADLSEVRSAYRAACLAPSNRTTVEAFIDAAEAWVGPDTANAFHRGLLATARIMRAETLWNPMEKLQTFHAQRAPLESAIAAAPEHPELRLFRLSVQWSVPFFLDYSSDMEEDAARVADALEQGFWSDDSEQGAFALTFINHLRDDASN
jgi:hypothetical protein